MTEAQVEIYVGGIVGYLSFGGSSSSPLMLTASGTANVSGEGINVGGLVGYVPLTASAYLSKCHTEMQITANSGNTSAYAGGLIGHNNSSITITDSYATGDVTVSGSSVAYAGGLVGGSYGAITVADSYATGDVTASGSSHAYVGGLVGYAISITVRNAYSSSAVSAEGGGTVYVGGLAGYVGNVSLENAHWLKSAETDAVYAVGYSSNLGVPTSIGSTSHTILDEFYTLADTLNAGREVPVWEHTGESTLPSLITGDDESAE